MSFANQVAIITGASSGIGWELAKSLARQGCAIGAVARRKERLEALVAEIQAAGGKAAWATADVTDRQQTFAAIHALRNQLGPVDLLVANSGIGKPTALEPINLDDIEQTFKVNTLGVVFAIAAVLPEMLQRGQGHLAAISSVAAYKGLPGESAYCASKAAVNAYLEGLRIHLCKTGIHVTTICPGFIETEMTADYKFKMPWIMKADRAAGLIVNALDRKKKVYNFPWQITPADEIDALAPRPDRPPLRDETRRQPRGTGVIPSRLALTAEPNALYIILGCNTHVVFSMEPPVNITQFQQNRAIFPQERLAAYEGRWVAFSGDGRSVLASGDTLDQVENQLVALGADPEKVFLERILGPEDDMILGGDLPA